MTPDSKPQRRLPQRRPAGEVLVLMAITLVSAAFGTGLYLQFGVGLWSAVFAALGVYLALIVVHALVRRSQAIRELSYEVDRLENEVMRIARGVGPMSGATPELPNFRSATPAPSAMMQGQPPVSRPPPPARPAHGRLAAGPGGELASYIPRPPQGGVHGGPSVPVPPSRRPAQEGPGRAGQAPANVMAAAPTPKQTGAGHAAPGAAPTGADQRSPAGMPESQADSSMARYWSARPTDALPETMARPGAVLPQAPVQSQRPRGDSSAGAGEPLEIRDISQRANIEDDVDVINDMIRRYSEEIGAPNPGRQAAAGSPHGNSDAEAISRGEAAISVSVGALRAAAGEMRRPTEPGPSAIERGILPPLRIDPESTAPQPPPVGPDHALAAQLADAITKQTLDVFLEPILGLADRKARHYEISLSLRTGAGGIGPEQCSELALNTGMLPLLDANRVSRASVVARHLDERGSAGCLFAALSAASLASERFLGQFAEIYKQAPRLGERLVFSIGQGEVRGFSPAQWSTVRQLAASGFRFAIEDVTSVDLDLPELKAAGFAFMRIGAQALIDGVAGLDGSVPVAEVCRRLEGSGLTLMAVDLESEEQLDSVLGAGVPLGQGPLFGRPRPVKAEALRLAKSAAA